MINILHTSWFYSYIQKGDQASIIGGAIEFIKEMQLVLQSLESKKKRKSLSPSPTPSPRSLFQLNPSPPNSNSPLNSDSSQPVKELSACCNSPVADVEAKISGSNVVLRTLSKRIPGQVVKIVSALERLDFEILHLNISSMEDTVLYSFVIKVRIYMFIYTCMMYQWDIEIKIRKGSSLDRLNYNIFKRFYC